MLSALSTDEQKAYNEAILHLNPLGIGFDISKYKQEVEVNFSVNG